MEYFFDAYAIIEMINQNPAYSKFNGCRITTSLIHLAEVHYHLLITYNEQTADYWVRKMNFSFIDISLEIVIKASKLKFRRKKSKLSYADCIGYITSIENNMIFVTGDKQFKNAKDVEFVK